MKELKELYTMVHATYSKALFLRNGDRLVELLDKALIEIDELVYYEERNNEE